MWDRAPWSFRLSWIVLVKVRLASSSKVQTTTWLYLKSKSGSVAAKRCEPHSHWVGISKVVWGRGGSPWEADTRRVPMSVAPSPQWETPTASTVSSPRGDSSDSASSSLWRKSRNVPGGGPALGVCVAIIWHGVCGGGTLSAPARNACATRCTRYKNGPKEPPVYFLFSVLVPPTPPHPPIHPPNHLGTIHPPNPPQLLHTPRETQLPTGLHGEQTINTTKPTPSDDGGRLG